jgi:sugar lactone lactonase YvrE
MARHRWSILGALLLAGCTTSNPDYAGVVDLDARPDLSASGGVSGQGGQGPSDAGGSAGTGGVVATGGAGGAVETGGSGGVNDPTPEPPVDAASPDVDAAIEAAPEVPPEQLCGTERPTITSIVAADGLAIARDGTIYYSTTDDTHGYVGRLRPRQPLENHWQRLDNQPITWGLALDSANNKLYFASDTTIFGFDLGFDPPLRFPVGAKLTNINDMAVGPDGSLFLSVQSDRHIYRVVPSPSAVATRVSTMPLGTAAQNDGPAALTFGADGALYIGMAGKSAIVRMVLEGLVERSHANFGTFTGWANGLAFDRTGRLYVGLWDSTIDQEIALLTPTGTPAGKVVVKGRFASMAFGRGALNCRDLYVANPLGPMTRVETDTPGLPAP